MAALLVNGSLHLLFLHDVADEIHLEGVARELGLTPEPPTTEPFPPHYVRFEKPPLTEVLPALILPDGHQLSGSLRYYEYGIVSVTFVLPFSSHWDDLAGLACKWTSSPDVESHAAARVAERLSRLDRQLLNAYPPEARLTEDYTVMEIQPVAGPQGPLPASTAFPSFAAQTACIIRGETAPLSEAETAEVLEASISYFPYDLVVAGWSMALVYDTPEAARLTMRLLEYANVQLLEFRHYDDVLSRVLAGEYKSLERKWSIFRRWGLAREAAVLNRVLLDVREITERMDNSIKFLSDMFSARLYRLASRRIGVPDYRKLVEDKLTDATEVYRFMIDEFNHARVFVLESAVVIILIIDLVVLFFPLKR